MAKQKKPVHRVQMTEGKRNIIHQLLEEYDIQTAEDSQDALKDLLGGTIKEMMEAEIEDHLGYEVPQDRKSTFQPQVVKKRQKDILILCADGLTGIKEAIAASFPKTEYQRCIVHPVRNTLKYVPDKDRKAFATDLKTIYQAPDEKKALYLATFEAAKRWTTTIRNWGQVYGELSIMYEGRLPY